MRPQDIDAIVIHCSASRAGQDVRASDIDKWHKERGFKMIGYNFVIDLDGTVEVGRPLTMNGAHCNTSGVCGRPSPAQKAAMHKLVMELIEKYPITDVLGHRDASPDKNHDGKITRNEWIKDCPCFDVRSEFPIAVCTAKRK